jgi:elongator complex protein 3
MQNNFDPFLQVSTRLEALDAVGHPIDKIELLILGGTFTAYDLEYQEWFIRRCFDALNGYEAKTLEEAQIANEDADHRNVGLVIETRPDEVTRLSRPCTRTGVTKVQIGAQAGDDVMLNKAAHTGEPCGLSACFAGRFKVVLHWMPNLLGAPFKRPWVRRCGAAVLPDESKCIPQLVETRNCIPSGNGRLQPYTRELIQLMADLKITIRVIAG